MNVFTLAFMNKYNPSVCVYMYVCVVCVYVCMCVCVREREREKDIVDWVSLKAENHFEIRTIKEQQGSGRGPF
jgi:hypothetical protein